MLTRTTACYRRKTIRFSVDISPRIEPSSNLHWQNSIELSARFALGLKISLAGILLVRQLKYLLVMWTNAQKEGKTSHCIIASQNPSYQSQFTPAQSGLGSVSCPNFLKNACDIIFHCTLGKAEFISNFAIAMPFGE
jgi:hypothetical protein